MLFLTSTEEGGNFELSRNGGCLISGPKSLTGYP